MGNLCQQGAHVIQQMEPGHALHRCAECGQAFLEHHEIHIQVGVGATFGPPVPPRPSPQPPPRREA